MMPRCSVFSFRSALIVQNDYEWRNDIYSSFAHSDLKLHGCKTNYWTKEETGSYQTIHQDSECTTLRFRIWSIFEICPCDAVLLNWQTTASRCSGCYTKPPGTRGSHVARPVHICHWFVSLNLVLCCLLAFRSHVVFGGSSLLVLGFFVKIECHAIL